MDRRTESLSLGGRGMKTGPDLGAEDKGSVMLCDAGDSGDVKVGVYS